MSNGTNQIDAIAIKGIAAKVQQVLALPGTILSFPLQPIAYAKDDLHFLAAGGLSATQAQTLAEFSELVNRVPVAGQVWRDDGTGRHLWDVYGQMLGAELASSQRNTQEEARYQQALGYLRTAGPDGLDHPSPALTSYRAYQSAYITALSASRVGQDGPDADALKAASDRALADWKLEGHKDEVEEELLTMLTLGDKDPSVVWSNYRTQFDPSQPTEYQTAPNGLRYATTGFAPTGVMDVPWVQIKLSRDDLVAASANASTELVNALGGSDVESIHEVSFEFIAVDVMRPWFDAAMFGSRGWRLSGAGPLSDGASPPTGSCPAFVTRVVFARNISVSRAKTDAGEATPSIAFAEPVTVKFAKNRIVPPPIFVAEPPPLISLVNLRIQPSRIAARPEGLMRRLPDRGNVVLGDEQPVLRARTLKADIDVVQRFDFPIRKLPVVVNTPPIVVKPSPGDDVVTTPPEFVFIMALQCQLLGATPNPDPNLPWP